jgi:hypothetical protein
MKKVSLALAFVFSVSMLSSCGSSPYKKRKGCKGNGSWSGNRNLGAVDKVQKAAQTNDTYVWTTKEVQLEKI